MKAKGNTQSTPKLYGKETKVVSTTANAHRIAHLTLNALLHAYNPAVLQRQRRRIHHACHHISARPRLDFIKLLYPSCAYVIAIRDEYPLLFPLRTVIRQIRHEEIDMSRPLTVCTTNARGAFS